MTHGLTLRGRRFLDGVEKWAANPNRDGMLCPVLVTGVVYVIKPELTLLAAREPLQEFAVRGVPELRAVLARREKELAIRAVGCVV